MTEQEARQKWCPFARAIVMSGGDQSNTFNRLATDNVSSPMVDESNGCIASDCMAWRWEDKAVHAENRKTDAGYCGLAGKP